MMITMRKTVLASPMMCYSNSADIIACLGHAIPEFMTLKNMVGLLLVTVLCVACCQHGSEVVVGGLFCQSENFVMWGSGC
jgi:hypothetical protein